MANWARTETTITRITYALPTPAAYGELYRTVAAAEANYRRKYGLESVAMLPDDAITIRTTDDAVLVTFEVDTNQPPADE